MTLTQQTKVTLGLAGGVIVAVLAGYLWLDQQFQSVRSELQPIREDITDLRSRLDMVEADAGDSYLRAEAERDALRNAIANPGVRFADPQHPGDYIMVDVGRGGGP